MAMLVAPEAKAALEVGATLPTVPELVQRVRGSDTLPTPLAQASTLWDEASVEGDPAAAAELRESAYALAAPLLAVRMDSAALAGVQGRLERWIRLADAALKQSEFRDLSTAVDSAREQLSAARAAQARHDTVAAVLATLRASDDLTETTPQAVAARLASEDEAALVNLRRLAGRPAAEESRLRLDRIDRLTRGAR
ncbi:MAG TPA: hypothetical protein VF832_04430, partial [Longimicrobiales bacterium]